MGFAVGCWLRDEPWLLHVPFRYGVLGAAVGSIPGAAGHCAEAHACRDSHQEDITGNELLGWTPWGVPVPSGKASGSPGLAGHPLHGQGEGAAGGLPSPALQSTVRHLIVPVPTISLAWIYALRGHLWRDSNNMTLLAFLFLL